MKVCQAIINQALGKREITPVIVDKRKTIVTCTNCCNSTEICNVGGQCGTNRKFIGYARIHFYVQYCIRVEITELYFKLYGRKSWSYSWKYLFT